MKVVSVVGARPQFVKCVLVSKEMQKRGIQEILVHTGQHYDYKMSEMFFKDLEIPSPRYDLAVKRISAGERLAEMIDKLDPIIRGHDPDIVLVYGDTDSTLAGALAAGKLGIPVAHVEAGCRSYDRTMPEEINRVIVDYIANLRFCPTFTALRNLFNDDTESNRLTHFTGDLNQDMIDFYRPIFECKPKICDDPYVLMTIHRPSNTDSEARMDRLMDSLGNLSTQVIFPAHPRTTKMMFKWGNVIPSNVQLVDPLSYVEMLGAINNAEHVITDSGGVQKEAYMLKVPCTTIRDTTEWPETLENGWNVLSDPKDLVKNVMRKKPTIYVEGCFGYGNAATLIVDLLEEGILWYKQDR